MKKLLEKDATDVEVTDRACKNGDTVNIDFSGSVDGEKFPGGTAEDYNLVLGSGSFIPGFEDAVVGMKVGENKDINVKFPEDYQADNLRGKDSVFNITLHKITEKKYPELTDEYVKSHAGMETVDDLKKKTRERLEKAAVNKSRDDNENSILSEICKHAKAEIPDAMLENEIDGMVQDFSYRLMYQGIKLEEYLKYMQLSMEQFRSQFKEQALPRVMSQLVIDKIIRTEKITADDKDPRQVEYIKNDIIVTKLFAFLEANNEMYTEEAKKPAAKKTTAGTTEKKPAAKKTTTKKPAADKE